MKRNLVLPSVMLGAAVAICSVTMSKADITYNVDLTGFGASITGTIETDGTIGALGGNNIVSYSLTLSQGSNSALITGSCI